MDCTIRDGSYVIDYQFNVEDTFIVARGLSQAGIRHIEVGHGLGLNAQNVGKGSAAISDSQYISTARAAVKGESLIGSFFIPGIGTEDSLRAAADAGLDFVRLGIDVDEYMKLEPFTQLAKSLGLEVWGNMMKSYIVPPEKFGDIARRVGEGGVDVVALVDSAGGMTPDDVQAYTEACVERTDIPLAFHGHNNLTLAVANCLRFVQVGGRYVDGSLAGLGRSGGNAATELLASLLAPRGLLSKPIDWEYLIQFADAVMAFMVPFHSRHRSVEIATGLNYFHSSFSAIIEEAANAEEAELFRAILNLPVESRKKLGVDTARMAARHAREKKRMGAHFGAENLKAEVMERYQPASLQDLADRLRILKGKTPQKCIITVAHVPGIVSPRLAPLRSTTLALISHVEVANEEGVCAVIRVLSDVCDAWLLDVSFDPGVIPVKDTPVYFYRDSAVIAQAVADALQVLRAKRVAVIGDDLRVLMNERWPGLNADYAGSVDALVLGDPASSVDVIDLERVHDGGLVLIVRSGGISEPALSCARERRIRLWRIDCGPSLIAEAERMLNTHERFCNAAGEREIAPDVRVVAGGVVGQSGDLVVDHIGAPRFILGQADGRGGIKSVDTRDPRLFIVQEWILSRWGI